MVTEMEMYGPRILRMIATITLTMIAGHHLQTKVFQISKENSLQEIYFFVYEKY